MRVVFALCLLAVATATRASAQVLPQFELTGSYNAIAGPTFFSEYWSSGLGVAGAVSLPVNRYFQITGDFGYSRFPLQNSKVRDELQREKNSETASDNLIRTYLGLPPVQPGTVSLDGGELSIVTAMFGARMTYPVGRISPFLSGTFGLYREQLGEMNISGDTMEGSSENAAALRVGVGLTVSIRSNVGVVSALDWTLGFTEGESVSYVPLRLGLFIVP